MAARQKILDAGTQQISLSLSWDELCDPPHTIRRANKKSEPLGALSIPLVLYARRNAASFFPNRLSPGRRLTGEHRHELRGEISISAKVGQLNVPLPVIEAKKIMIMHTRT